MEPAIAKQRRGLLVELQTTLSVRGSAALACRRTVYDQKQQPRLPRHPFEQTDLGQVQPASVEDQSIDVLRAKWTQVREANGARCGLIHE